MKRFILLQIVVAAGLLAILFITTAPVSYPPPGPGSTVTYTTVNSSTTYSTNGFFCGTNAMSLTLTAGKAYMTNLTANITLTAFAGVPNNLLWSIYLYATNNNSGADRTITFPNGCRGLGGATLPPVYYVTNNACAEFQVTGYGNTVTNVNWSPH